MLYSEQMLRKLETGEWDRTLMQTSSADELSRTKERCRQVIEEYRKAFGEEEFHLFSAPGRTEIGGNHTDHQHGKVLAAAVNLDVLAAAGKSKDPVIHLISAENGTSLVNIEDLSARPEEKETTGALIRGVLADLKQKGFKVGGFHAYLTSDVLIGSGLSSSAAFETLIGTIVSCLYNDRKISPERIAMAGQCAENKYFGKPSGLMDQMACACGGLITIDFANQTHPESKQIRFDFANSGYCLCITDTKGSHADLTADYAAIPFEMKRVASCFGKQYLGEVDEREFRAAIPELRKSCGDRAVLRAFHFFRENDRVQQEVEALSAHDMERFLKLVKESGRSSFEYLQNVYTAKDVSCQNLSVALALSDACLENEGASRVHGGGFAGTIQAFVRREKVSSYKIEMEKVFGDGSCRVLTVRPCGGIQIDRQH